MIDEQNAVAGLTNRVLARCNIVFCWHFQMPCPFFFSASNSESFKREEIVSLPTPEERFNTREGSIRILIIGGSQGARALNQHLPAVLAKMSESLSIWHQTGEADCSSTKQVYIDWGQQEIKVLSPSYKTWPVHMRGRIWYLSCRCTNGF